MGVAVVITCSRTPQNKDRDRETDDVCPFFWCKVSLEESFQFDWPTRRIIKLQVEIDDWLEQIASYQSGVHGHTNKATFNYCNHFFGGIRWLKNLRFGTTCAMRLRFKMGVCPK